MTNMQQISDIISEKLNSGDMSVSELAASVGCSRQYVYDLIDKDREKPRQLTLQMAERFARACGFSLTISKKKNGGKKAG